MTTVTLTNAARWNLDKAKLVAKRGNKREAERLRANAQRCLRLIAEGNVS
jgi:hypothetical protein